MEHRLAPRLRAILKAEIRFNNGFSVSCLVRDISETGARLQLTSEIALPDRFDLFIEKRNETRRVAVEWNTGKEVGIAFDAAEVRPSEDAAGERISKLEAEVAALRHLLEEMRTSHEGAEQPLVEGEPGRAAQ